MNYTKTEEYTEIFRLKEMLEKANIPFEIRKLFDGFQIGYPSIFPAEQRIISAIEHLGSYGHESDLLEIRGGLTSEESKHDTVKGYLIAEDVFYRIENDFLKRKITLQVMRDGHWVDSIRSYATIDEAEKRLKVLDEVGIVARIKPSTDD